MVAERHLCRAENLETRAGTHLCSAETIGLIYLRWTVTEVCTGVLGGGGVGGWVEAYLLKKVRIPAEGRNLK